MVPGPVAHEGWPGEGAGRCGASCASLTGSPAPVERGKVAARFGGSRVRPGLADRADSDPDLAQVRVQCGQVRLKPGPVTGRQASFRGLMATMIAELVCVIEL